MYEQFTEKYFQSLPANNRSAILVAIAERLQEDHRAYCKRYDHGDYGAYQNALDIVWRHVQTDNTTLDEIKQAYIAVRELAPDADEIDGSPLDGHCSSLAMLCALRSCCDIPPISMVANAAEPITLGFHHFLPVWLLSVIATEKHWTAPLVNTIRRDCQAVDLRIDWAKWEAEQGESEVDEHAQITSNVTILAKDFGPEFWSIIKDAQGDPHLLLTKLEDMTAEAVQDFGAQFNEATRLLVLRVEPILSALSAKDPWDLCRWIVLQGKTPFENTLQNPENVSKQVALPSGFDLWEAMVGILRRKWDGEC